MAFALISMTYGVLCGELFCHSAGVDCLVRSGVREYPRRRGITTTYGLMASLFMLLMIFMSMMLAMADFF